MTSTEQAGGGERSVTDKSVSWSSPAPHHGITRKLNKASKSNPVEDVSLSHTSFAVYETPKADPASSPATKVFNIAELIEILLLNIDTRDREGARTLLFSQRINRMCHAIIHANRTLRTKLFWEDCSLEDAVKLGMVNLESRLPVLEREMGFGRVRVPNPLLDIQQTKCGFFLAASLALQPLLSQNGGQESWRRMTYSVPSYKVTTCFAMQEPRMDLAVGQWKSAKINGISWWETWGAFECSLVRDAGACMGDIVDDARSRFNTVFGQQGDWNRGKMFMPGLHMVVWKDRFLQISAAYVPVSRRAQIIRGTKWPWQ